MPCTVAVPVRCNGCNTKFHEVTRWVRMLLVACYGLEPTPFPPNPKSNEFIFLTHPIQKTINYPTSRMLTNLCFIVSTHESHIGFLLFQSDMLIKEWFNNKVTGIKAHDSATKLHGSKYSIQQQNYRDRSI